MIDDERINPMVSYCHLWADDSPFVCSICVTRCDLWLIRFRCLNGASSTRAESELSSSWTTPMRSSRLYLVVAQLSPVRSAEECYFAK